MTDSVLVLPPGVACPTCAVPALRIRTSYSDPVDHPAGPAILRAPAAVLRYTVEPCEHLLASHSQTRAYPNGAWKWTLEPL